MPNDIRSENESTQPISNWWWLLIAAVTVLIFFFGLSIPLLGPDEPRYAQVAREMFDRGDWITPTLGGFNWFEKPSMLYWLEIVAYRIFGVTEFAARLGPAVFGLGTCASLWFLGRFESRSSERAENSASPALGNWLALIAASSLGIIVFSRGASFDIIVTFPITASLVSFYIYDRQRSESFTAKYLPLISFYFFIGVALLAKGLIGIVFPFAIVAFYYVLSLKMPERSFIVSLVWGTVIAAAVAATWYVPIYERHGYQFIDEFIIQHHFQRFTSNKYQHPQPFYFYLWILPLMTIPWLPFLIVSVWNLCRSGYVRLTTHNSGREISPILVFAAAWCLVPLVFFSISGSKLPGYILPSVPAAVVLAGVYVSNLAARSKKWSYGALGLGVSTLLICAILLATVVPQFADGDSVKTLIAKASERGYGGDRVLNFFMTSHNAEFYAAGRLLRDDAGKQRPYWATAALRGDIALLGGKPVLVLVRLERLQLLRSDPTLDVETIADNGDTAITRVSLKPLN